ncbi:MAG: PLP-dependent transferase, partial [Proteobacteria bacterium]|nr:PLP-dependent transferase [Pseudomonadota bacterium]
QKTHGPECEGHEVQHQVRIRGPVLPQEVAPVRSATRWDAPGPLIRLHIGLEDVEDLKEDLDAALKRFEKTL